MITLGKWDEETQEKMDVAIWFPGRFSGAPLEIEGYTIPSVPSTRIVPGFYPIILLSHDMASSRFANNDIAISLAEQGFIVIAPSHNGDTQINSSSMLSIKNFFDRPRQMLHALEMVLSTPELAPYADESRIGIIGVGTGAITALQLAGASPSFNNFAIYCKNAPKTDIFCAPWVTEKTLSWVTDAKKVIATHGSRAFTPPIDFFAPHLVLAPLPIIKAPEPEKSKPSLWKRITHSWGDTQEPLPTTPAAPVEVPLPLIPESITVKGNYIYNDFYQTNLWGINTAAKQSTHLTQEANPTFSLKLVPQQKKKKKPQQTTIEQIVFQRPASVRQVAAIALVAPSGSMFFTPEAMANVNLPTFLIEAEKDELYPPKQHAFPFHSMLPRKPRVLTLPNADHFSLFAPCSQEMLESLPAACGSITGAERQSLTEMRDTNLYDFFSLHLGAPLPVPPPSGLAASPLQIKKLTVTPPVAPTKATAAPTPRRR